MAKNLVSGLILDHLVKIGDVTFFFKNLAPSVTRYHGQLLSCTISEKNYDPILRKLNDGWTDRRTDEWTHKQTKESDFIGRCLTSVERPKIKNTWRKSGSK